MHILKKLGIDFWLSITIVFLFVIWGVVKPDQVEQVAKAAFDYTTTTFGGFYLVLTACFIVFVLFLAVSKYGNIRLGKDDDKPEYSFFNWIGMLFSAGFGVALVFWGVAEPIKHYINPPLAIQSETTEAARLSIQYAMFHWGIHQWAIFSVIGLSIAYFKFRREERVLISTVLIPYSKRNSFFHAIIQVLAVVATATGVATSLGLGVMQINGGLHHVFNIPDTLTTQLVVILILLIMYQTSSLTGLDKGIRILSTINLNTVLLLMFFVFFAGPTLFIVKTIITGIGDYLTNTIQMSFNLSPYRKDDWVKDWTIFYWAWGIAWSPFVGSFIARVSKGRTIREFVFAVLFVPALVAAIWMAVFGGSALYFEIVEGYEIADTVQEDIAKALFITLDYLPFGEILSILSIALIFTFLVTSADSATFVLGMMTTKGNPNPPNLVKLVWGIFQAAIATVLLMASGLKGLQTASLVAALPFSIIMIFMCYSLFKSIRDDTTYTVKSNRNKR